MPNDEQKRELKQKIGELIATRYSGNAQAAFDAYAAAGLVDRTNLKSLLGDAGIGSAITRGAWADGILDAVDTDRDRKISWDEFRTVYEG